MATSMMKEPPRNAPTTPADGFVSTLRDVTQNSETLMADHLKLARVELITEAKSSIKSISGAAITGVVGLVGYLLFMMGVAYLAARAMGPMGGFMLVGGLHLLGAGIGAAILYKKAKAMKAPLPESREEAERTVEVTKAALTSSDGGKHSGHHH